MAQEAGASKESVTVGVAQMSPVTGNLEENLKRVERLAREARALQPDLALLAYPELALSGYDCGPDFFDLAIAIDETGVIERLSVLAAELALVLVVGFPEATEAYGVIYDSALVIDADGYVKGSYRKTHCLENERHWFSNGDSLPVFATAAGRIGVMVCWDAAMPEAARILALQGADYLVVPAAWEDPHVSDLELVVSARAYDNVLPVLAVNLAGTERENSFSGHSRLVDCLGRPVATLNDEKDELLFGAVDLAGTRVIRRGYGSQLRDRRPDLYAPLLARHGGGGNEPRGRC